MHLNTEIVNYLSYYNPGDGTSRGYCLFILIDHKAQTKTNLGHVEFKSNAAWDGHFHYENLTMMFMHDYYELIAENCWNSNPRFILTTIWRDHTGAGGEEITQDVSLHPCFPSSRWGTYIGENTNNYTYKGLDYAMVYLAGVSWWGNYVWKNPTTFPGLASSWNVDGAPGGGGQYDYPNCTLDKLKEWIWNTLIDPNDEVQAKILFEEKKILSKKIIEVPSEELSWSEQTWPFDPLLSTAYFGNIGIYVPGSFGFWDKSVELYQKFAVLVGSMQSEYVDFGIDADIYTIQYSPIVICTPLAAFGRKVQNIPYTIEEIRKLHKEVAPILSKYVAGFFKQGLFVTYFIENKFIVKTLGLGLMEREFSLTVDGLRQWRGLVKIVRPQLVKAIVMVAFIQLANKLIPLALDGIMKWWANKDRISALAEELSRMPMNHFVWIEKGPLDAYLRSNNLGYIWAGKVYFEGEHI